MSEAHLAKMPAEVFETIVEYTDDKNLPALRLVSRECNSKALRTFTKTFFTTLPVLLCYDKSIRTALEIANHPTFAQAMHKVELCIDIIPDEDDLPYYELNIPWQKPKKNKMVAGLYDLCFCRQDHQFMAMLTTLFHRLRMRSNVEAMRIMAGELDCGAWPRHEFPEARVPCLRLQSFKQQGGICVEPAFYHEEADQWMEGIVEAVYACDLSITTLIMNTGEWGMPVEYWHDNNEDVFRHLGGFFSQLEHLHIPLTWDWQGEDHCIGQLEALAKALGSASKLTRLELGPHNNEKQEYCDNINDLLSHLSDGDLPQLETLVLDGGLISALLLARMVKARSLLRRLELEEVYLFDHVYDTVQALKSGCFDVAPEVKSVTGFGEVKIGKEVEFDNGL